MPLRPGGRLAGGLLGLSSFRLLFGATLASSVGTWLAYVALIIDVYDRTGSAAWVSALLIAEFAPLIVAGLLAGPLLDRLPRRRLLIGSDLVRVAVFCIIPFASSTLQIVILALIAGTATSCFRPALYAGLPNLVDEARLPRANGLLQASENGTQILGPIIGGVLVAASGPEPAYWVNAASFAVSAGLIAAITQSLERGTTVREGHWRELVAGLALVRRSPGLLVVLVAWGIVMAAAGLIGVSEIVLAKEVFDAGDAGYGLMLSAMGVGLVVGGVRAGSILDRRGLRASYVAALGAMAVGMAATAAAPGVWVAAALLVLAGLGNGVALVGNALLVQRGVADDMRGRAFTVAMSVTAAALGAGTIAAGPLTDAVGARVVWAIAAALTAAGAGAGAVLLRRLAAPERRAAPSEQRV